MKKALRRHKHCALALVSQIPAADPLPGGAGWPKINQLEMVTIFTNQPTLLVKINARNFELSFRVIVVTDPQTNTATKPQTDRTDGCSVMKKCSEAMQTLHAGCSKADTQTGLITIHCAAASLACSVIILK